MLNIFIVLIIVAVIWVFNPLKFTNFKSPLKLDKKTRSEVNRVVDQTTQQVNYARQMQKREQQQNGE
ncbi:MAG: hypothetical protein PHC64_11240 [Candidatus Gastranaerophilales bacterium]|nr:hypothetical protein [Candidatus Gastranaerophilales bacterium]